MLEPGIEHSTGSILARMKISSYGEILHRNEKCLAQEPLKGVSNGSPGSSPVLYPPGLRPMSAKITECE